MAFRAERLSSRQSLSCLFRRKLHANTADFLRRRFARVSADLALFETERKRSLLLHA